MFQYPVPTGEPVICMTHFKLRDVTLIMAQMTAPGRPQQQEQ